MDNSKYAILAEGLKIVLGFSFIYLHNLNWFNLDGVLVMGICSYLIISFILTCNFYLINFKNKSIISS